ncbi:MAG: MerR family DNA-binding protein, partial [Spirochaetales bacterium]|nr:MerR family DNA-binding protein [Spirochaetales bacterium]
YYDKLGLFPSLGRNDSGYRDFSEEEVEWGLFIKKLKETGMKIEDMARFARLREQGPATVKERIAFIEKHQKDVEERLESERLNLERFSKGFEICKSKLLP